MTLAIARSGTGPHLVLLHGWGADSREWGVFADLLTEHFRVHAVDLPGHGYSAGIRVGDIRAVAETVAAKLPSEAVVVGWSMGGMIALQLALAHPDLCRKLVLISTTPKFCADEGWTHGASRQNFTAFTEALRNTPEALLARFRAQQRRGDTHERRLRRTPETGPDPAPQPNIEALDTALGILRDTDFREQVGRIQIPTLLIHGAADVVIPLAAARWLAQHLPQARLIELAGCAHQPFLSEPEACLAAVRQFACD